MRRIPKVAIIGWKNSGKTTLLTRLVSELGQLGLAVGTVKHSSSSPQGDQKGSDTWRHLQAGAQSVVLVSPDQVMSFHAFGEEPGPRDLCHLFTGCDVILLEGYKDSDLPKIEVHRTCLEHPYISLGDPALLALVTDDQSPPSLEVPVLRPHQVQPLASHIVKVLVEPARKDSHP